MNPQLFKQSFTATLRRWSHIGRRPVVIPPGVTVTHALEPPPNRDKHLWLSQSTQLHVSGPLGQTTVPVFPFVKLDRTEHEISVSVDDSTKRVQRASWGYRG